jgi:hypothetical protein
VQTQKDEISFLNVIFGMLQRKTAFFSGDKVRAKTDVTAASPRAQRVDVAGRRELRHAHQHVAVSEGRDDEAEEKREEAKGGVHHGICVGFFRGALMCPLMPHGPRR